MRISVWLMALLLSGCIAVDDDDDNPRNSEGDEVDDTSLALNGFWNGGFDQTDTLRILIYNGDVYALDDELGFFGSVTSPADEEIDMTLTAYPFAFDDENNNEYVADGIAVNYTINGLQATLTSIVGSYETDKNDFGSFNIENDGSYTNNSSLTGLTGQWTTTDLQLNVTSRGRFLGVNTSADSNCSFEGQFEIIDQRQSLMTFTVNRRNCDDYNGDATGLAAINADGELELYSRNGNALLFMKFSAPTGSAGGGGDGGDSGSGGDAGGDGADAGDGAAA